MAKIFRLFFLLMLLRPKKTPPPHRDKLGQSVCNPPVSNTPPVERFSDECFLMSTCFSLCCGFACWLLFAFPKNLRILRLSPRAWFWLRWRRTWTSCARPWVSAKHQPGLMEYVCPVSKKSSHINHLCKLLMLRSLCFIADYHRSHVQARVAFVI